MLDYEEYGNSFRTPRAMRPNGSPANNPANAATGQGGSPNPEGRPPTQTQRGGLQAPAPYSGAGGSAQPDYQPQSFRQLQAQGMARPPMPMAQLNPRMGTTMAQGGGGPEAPPHQPNGGMQYSPSQGGAIQGFSAQQPQQQMQPDYQPQWLQGFSPQQQQVGEPQQQGGNEFENSLLSRYQNYQQPHGFSGGARRANMPAAYQGQGFGGQYNAYQTPGVNYTGQFGGQGGEGGQVDQQTGQSVMQGLQNPSRWDNDLIKSQYDQLAGGIDDQYNAADLNLQGSLAKRGLGQIGDTTIGANDARYQNLQRRTAKSDALQSIMSNAANTQAADRSQAISAGLGYGGQQYGQGLSTYGANMGANQQNFGQNMAASQFGADQQQQQYNTDFARNQYNTGIGQQNYQNQLGQSQYEQGLNQQDYQNEASNFGMNQAANQQGFNQQQGLLNNYLGYGQQSFQNQQAASQQDSQQQQQQYENLLRLLGY